MSRTRMPFIAVAAVLFAAAPAIAQQPVTPCPEPESGDASPIEVRALGLLIRAHVNAAGTTAAGDSARVEARLVSCEDTGRRDAAVVPDAGGALFRLLSDLRLGIQFAPSADGRCFRAQIEVADDGPEARRSRIEEPVGIQLCGLQFGREPASPPARRM